MSHDQRSGERYEGGVHDAPYAGGLSRGRGLAGGTDVAAMRDIEKEPYSKDEARVAKFFFDRGIGGGPDPIGSLMASHEAMAQERDDAVSFIRIIGEELALRGLPMGDREVILANIRSIQAILIGDQP
jgi:hypothetical protein